MGERGGGRGCGVLVVLTTTHSKKKRQSKALLKHTKHVSDLARCLIESKKMDVELTTKVAYGARCVHVF